MWLQLFDFQWIFMKLKRILASCARPPTVTSLTAVMPVVTGITGFAGQAAGG
jgi:hypothetical protein